MSEGDIDAAAEHLGGATQDFLRRVRVKDLRPRPLGVPAGSHRTGWLRRKTSIFRTVTGWTVREPFVYRDLDESGGSVKTTVPGIYVVEDGSVLIGGLDGSEPTWGASYANKSPHGADEIVHALEAFLAEHHA